MKPGITQPASLATANTASPMPKMGAEGVSGGLVNVSAFPGNMMQAPRNRGNRPSGVPVTGTKADRAPVEIVNAQGPHAISFPTDILTGDCDQCSNIAAAQRTPAEPPSTTVPVCDVAPV